MNFSEKEWEIVIDGLARDFTAQFHGGDINLLLLTTVPTVTVEFNLRP